MKLLPIPYYANTLIERERFKGLSEGFSKKESQLLMTEIVKNVTSVAC
jgi:hypothetical protein